MRHRIRTAFLERLRGSSVLSRLTASYVVLITVLALAIGTSAHAIASWNYNRQVADLNQRLLQRYATIIDDNVISEASRIHQDLCLNLTLKTDIDVLFEKNYDIVKVKRLYDELLKIVSASDGRVEAIHIRSIPNDFHISSVMGFKDNSEINRKTLPNLYWSANADQESARAIWMPARTIHYTTTDQVNVISYVATYPPMQPFSRAKGIITIDLREDYVRGVLGRVSPQDTRQTLIADPSGNLITHDSHAIPATLADLGFPLVETLLAESWDDRVMSLPDGDTMVSRVNLSNGWVLMQGMPLEDFRAVSRTIGVSIALLSMAAVLLAMAIARAFARRIHLPLARIQARVGELLLQGEGERATRDEYVIIDRALSEMQVQLRSLSGIQAHNLPLLKENLLHALLGGTIKSQGEYEHMVEAIGYEPGPPEGVTVAVLLDWSHGASERACAVEPVTEARARVLVDRIRARIATEELHHGGFMLGALTSGSCLTLLRVGGQPLSVNWLEKRLAEVQEVLGVCPVLAIGSRRKTPFEAGLSARDAEQALAFRFFHPDRQVFDIEDFPFADSDPEGEPEVVRKLAQYADALRTNDAGEADRLVRDVVRWMGEAPVPAAIRRRYGRDAARILHEYAKTVHVSDEDPIFQIRNPVEQLPDVHAFQTWWHQATVRLFGLKQHASRHTTDDVVAAMRQYIAENLSGELSLTRLSEHTGLSKNYISHIFKEATGLNLINFITDQRMAEARTMLGNHNLNIETIARRLGYETPHYFSKKFRQYYGITPSAYRLGHLQDRALAGTMQDPEALSDSEVG